MGSRRWGNDKCFFYRWLRDKPNYYVDNNITTFSDRDAKVCEFFMRGRKVWDVNKLKDVFNSADVEAILSIRIPQNSTSDRVAWAYSSNGLYSVKSGYRYWH